jgi:hypothetical protein
VETFHYRLVKDDSFFSNKQGELHQSWFVFFLFTLITLASCSNNKTLNSVETKKEVKGKQKDVFLKRSANQVDIFVNGKPFTSYHFSGYNKPIFFPLRSASGKIITRGYPMIKNIPGESHDHQHHTGLWFTHGEINGVDFWSEVPNSGKIKHRQFDLIESGAQTGTIKSRSDWLLPSGKKVLDEFREVRIHKRDESRVMDFIIRLTAVNGPVKFGDTKEGSFGIRLAHFFTEKEGAIILNSEGETGEIGCWGKAARWVDYSTKISQESLGITILDHPQSFRHPTYWHARGYSLFAANPFGLHDFYNDETQDGSHLMKQGESISFHYRIYIHPGNAIPSDIEKEYRSFSKTSQ